MPRFIMLPAALVMTAGLYAGCGAAEPVQVQPVLSEPLPNVPGQAVTMVRVTFAPGAASPPHHHAGSVAVYVLKGTLRSKVDNGVVRDYHAGETFFEPAGALHAVSENPSKSEPAEILAVFVAPKGAVLTRNAAQ